jgi:hypothetical protein
MLLQLVRQLVLQLVQGSKKANPTSKGLVLEIWEPSQETEGVFVLLM